MKLFAFLAFVILEWYLLIRAGDAIDAFGVLIWCVVSAMLGVWVLKTHSMAVLGKMRTDPAAGRAPEVFVPETVLVLFAGLLLILPGFITDALGLLLLVPFFRRQAGGGLFRRVTREGGQGRTAGRILYFFSAFPGARGGFSAGRYDFGNNSAEPFDGSASPRQAIIIDSEPIAGTSSFGPDRAEASVSASCRRSPDSGQDSDAEGGIFDCEAEPAGAPKGEGKDVSSAGAGLARKQP